MLSSEPRAPSPEPRAPRPAYGVATGRAAGTAERLFDAALIIDDAVYTTTITTSQRM
jgi:hypothetical protein